MGKEEKREPANKCPICFKSFRVGEEFLIHIHLAHYCKKCKFHHLNPKEKNSCLRLWLRREILFPCPFNNCVEKCTNMYMLMYHIKLCHKKCQPCNRYQCQCFIDTPEEIIRIPMNSSANLTDGHPMEVDAPQQVNGNSTPIQVGGGPLGEANNPETNDDRQNVASQQPTTTGAEQQQQQPTTPEAEQQQQPTTAEAEQQQPTTTAAQQSTTTEAEQQQQQPTTAEAEQQQQQPWYPWQRPVEEPQPSTSRSVHGIPSQVGNTGGVNGNRRPMHDQSFRAWRPWATTPPHAAELRPVDEEERRVYRRIREMYCPYCDIQFPTREASQRHVINAHPEHHQEGGGGGGGGDQAPAEDPLNLYLDRSAIEDVYRVYAVNLNNIEISDLNALFRAIKEQFMRVVREILRKYRNCKVQFRIKNHFFRQSGDFIDNAFVPMESFNFVVENEHYATFAFNMALSNFNVRIEDFLENGSNWQFLKLTEFSILFSEYRAFTGSGHIPLPAPLAHKRACIINVPGDDEFCFVRCMIAALHKDEANYTKKHAPRKKVIATKRGSQQRAEQNRNFDTNRMRKLTNQAFYNKRMSIIEEELNFDGIRFPFDIKQAAKFERQNPNIGLNIYLYDESPETVNPIPDPTAPLKPKKPTQFSKQLENYYELRKHIFPIKICKAEKRQIIDLLLIQNGDEGHYVFVEDMLKLMKYPSRIQRILCRYCLQTFNKMADTHHQFCTALGRMKVDFPEDPIVKWRDTRKTIPLLYLGAMDFESRLIPINITKGNLRKTKLHKASAYAWAIRDKDGNIKSKNSFVAMNNQQMVAEIMLNELLEEAEKTATQVKQWNEEGNKRAYEANHNIPWPPNSQKCGFCKKPIFANGNKRFVRHHDHFPPFKFQFYAHSECNSTAQTSQRLVVLAHNLRGYDSHFLIKACAKKSLEKYQVEVIGTSSEKFFAIFVGENLVFIDSLNFFSASLDSVVKTMDKDTDFKLSRKHFMDRFKGKPNCDERVELMLTKGCYPYEYFQDTKTYEETELPPPEAFFDTLNNRPVDPASYEHAKKVWEVCEVPDLAEYTKLYNESDVFLLLDCFQKLRNVFTGNFGLDPAHYFSLPHLSWDCALRHTKAEFELIKDETMVPWLQSALRGGVASGLEYRAAKANNPFLPDYDPEKPNSYIMVHDVNNLYGHSLCSSLPTGGFKWIEKEEMENIRKDPKKYVDKIGDEAVEGCFLEVDMEFPKDIHDELKGLTPVPYKRVTEFCEYSEDMQKLARELGVADTAMKTPRLLADLYPRYNYVVHYRVLKFYASLGIKITKVHRGVTFDQEPILRKYILKLAFMRQKSSSDFEKNMWKLAANSVYGKSIEQVRNRCRFVIVKDRKKALKYNRKASVSQVILLEPDEDGEDLAIIRLKKLQVVLDKPNYVGIAVLDESKRILYDWFYNYAKKTWKDKIHTLATDTDSVISLIETENIYEDMYKDKNKFDMSDYDPTHETWKKYYCKDNMKVPGLMKDELCNKTASSFVFLRPKMYMYETVKEDGKNPDGTKRYVTGEVKKAKGLNRQCVRDRIQKGDYTDALWNSVQKRVECSSIQSKLHELYSVILNKKGLSSFEQKRFVLPDNISTLPFGHYLVRAEENLPSHLRPKRPRLEGEDDENMEVEHVAPFIAEDEQFPNAEHVTDDDDEHVTDDDMEIDDDGEDFDDDEDYVVDDVRNGHGDQEVSF